MAAYLGENLATTKSGRGESVDSHEGIEAGAGGNQTILLEKTRRRDSQTKASVREWFDTDGWGGQRGSVDRFIRGSEEP